MIDGMEFVPVPAGEFWMGSAESDQASGQDEMPQHQVFLDAYYIGRTPVTNAQYKAFADATRHRWDYSQGLEDHPAVDISWHDAVAFCEWLGRKAGRPVRLPTEAEWEKAARGTDGRIYPWGNEPPDESLCNFGGRMKETTPVGRYSPRGDSPYGCADMAGNVWEWCADWYDEGYYSRSPASNPQGPDSGSYKVLRGGSWFHVSRSTRSAYRNWYSPTYWVSHWGFRCAAVSVPLDLQPVSTVSLVAREIKRAYWVEGDYSYYSEWADKEIKRKLRFLLDCYTDGDVAIHTSPLYSDTDPRTQRDLAREVIRLFPNARCLFYVYPDESGDQVRVPIEIESWLHA